MKRGSCLTEDSYRWGQEMDIIWGQIGSMLHLWNNTVVILDLDKFKQESSKTLHAKLQKEL